MSKVVRASKYRHVFGTPAKNENSFDALRVANSAVDSSDFVACSPGFVAVTYETGGGGSVAVLPWSQTGKADAKLPLISGHKGAVLDLEFNPFNDSVLATVSDDCTAKIWVIPEGGLKETMTTSAQTLIGHKRKVGTLKFNPVANNILATTSIDYSVKIWDVEKGVSSLSLDGEHSDIINACVWKEDGSLLSTICKDKKLRIIDPRRSAVVSAIEAHAGTPKSRCLWLRDKILTLGVSKSSEREYILWDPKDLSKPLTRCGLDSSSGIIMPFFDPDTSMLYLAGKGDGNIRYFELTAEDPYIHYLSEYKSAVPQKGMGFLPKRAVSVSDCEIARLLKCTNTKIEPIAFCVPRKSEIFQDDLYPDCFSGEYTFTAAEWLGGATGNQKKMSLAPGFVAKPKQADATFEKKEEKHLSEKELRDEVERLTNRVGFLEAELVKRDAKIRDLEAK